MRCVYLQHSLSMNGRGSLQGRKLYDEFKKQCESTLLGYLVIPQESANQFRHPAVVGDIIAEITLAKFDPDLVFIGGGPICGTGSRFGPTARRVL